MSIEDNGLDPVLINTFIVDSKRCRVYFRKNVLIWESESLPVERTKVPVCDIIAVDYKHGKDCTCTNSFNSSSNLHTFQDTPGTTSCHQCFEVNYAKEKDKNKWRVVTASFGHGDTRQLSSWLVTLQNALTLQRANRPRRLLVFVNPFCGKRQGVKIYNKTVAPIFRLAQVECEVIETKHGGHSREVLFSKEINEYDGIVTVGGDGTVSEVMNSLVLRKLQDHRLDANNFNIDIPKIDIPVAIIPGGSTDCIAYCLNGTLDRKTAAIYAVLGDKFGLDICSVHSDRGLCRYFLSLLGYGFLGDVLKESEKHRWMGPKRYDYAGLLKFLRNKRYYCEVEMVLSPTKVGYSVSKCYKNCEVCLTVPEQRPKTRYQEENLLAIRNDLKLLEETDEEERKTKTIRGKYFLVSCANISCACERSPNGVAPFCHVGDGSIDLLLVQPRTLIDVLKLLIRSASKSQDVAVTDLPFIDTYKVRELAIRMIDKNYKAVTTMKEDGFRCLGSSVWNCDGEIVRDTNVRVKNYQQLVKVFTRRQSPRIENKNGSMCLRCFGSNES